MLKRDRGGGDTDTGEGHMKPEPCSTQPRAKEQLEPPEAGRARKDSPLEFLEGVQSC